MKKLVRRCSMLLLCCMLVGCFPARASAAAFRDMPSGHWARESISRCASLGFFQGKTADTFGVGQSMTRCAAVVVLDRFLGWEEVDFQLPYTDVPENAWYAGALRSAYVNGAVTGQSREFRPADPITREELAVMLIRALGYAAVSGVAQELPRTFTDIDTNPGYIAMARDFGLVSGIRADTFAPDGAATREQVAVILMRLYDKLHKETPASMEIVSSVEEMGGLDTVAIKGATLTSGGALKETLGSKRVQEIRAAAGEKEQLLYVSGTGTFLPKKADTAVKKLVDAVASGDYDGLVLEVGGVTAEHREQMTGFVKNLNDALGTGKLVLVLPAPDKDENSAVAKENGYDYSALGKAADQLVLRVTQPVRLVNKLPVAPPEPLEHVYWGISRLENMSVDLEKVSLMLTAEGVHYSGKNERGRLTDQEIRQQMASGWAYDYSERYGCAYLEKESGNEAIWYLDGTAAEDHLRMLKLLGVGGLCVENPAAASAAMLAVIR